MGDIGTPDYFGDRIHKFEGVTKSVSDSLDIADGTSGTLTLIDNRVGNHIKSFIGFRLDLGYDYIIVEAEIDGFGLGSCKIELYSPYVAKLSLPLFWSQSNININGLYARFIYDLSIDFHKSVKFNINNQMGAEIGFQVGGIYKDYSV